MEMNNINIQIKISEDLIKMYQDGSEVVQNAMQRALVKLGMEGDERIKRSMQNTGKANWFYRKPNGTIHWPSAPGYPPAVDEGRLLGSIVLDIRKGVIEIGSEKKGVVVNYALPLEEGTDRMLARPFVKPVGDWMESVVEERLRNSIKEALG